MKNAALPIGQSISGAIKIDEKEVFDHLDFPVRESARAAFNSQPGAVVDAICNANHHQQSPDLLAIRARSGKREQLNKAGEAELTVSGFM